MRVRVAKFGEEKIKAERQKLQKAIDTTRIVPIKDIAGNFINNLLDINIMSELPTLILMHSIAHSEFLIEGLQICSKFTKSGEVNESIFEELRQKMAEIPLDKDKVLSRYKQTATMGGYIWAELEVERILNMHEQHMGSYLNLQRSCVVWLWTTFEVSAGDLWETVLNVGFNQLGNEALKKMGRTDSPTFEDKIRGKYLKIDYLAEFDYNIKEHLGSMLKHHFDFTSLTGIQNAYKHVFPRSVTLERSLSNDKLRLLAEDRNLIVHKSSYIDARYKKITGTTQEIGDKLIIDGEDYAHYHITITKVFTDMLNCVNRYLR